MIVAALTVTHCSKAMAVLSHQPINNSQATLARLVLLRIARDSGLPYYASTVLLCRSLCEAAPSQVAVERDMWGGSTRDGARVEGTHGPLDCNNVLTTRSADSSTAAARGK